MSAAPQAVLYTDTARVVSVLHVDDDDLVPGMLDPAGLAMELSVELFDWLPDHAAVKAAGVASGATPTAVQQWDCLRLWCAYRAAASLLANPLSIRKTVSDGISTDDRFPLDLPAMLQDVKQKAAYYQATLVKSRTAVAPVFAAKLTSDTPAYDPVTG